MRAARRSRRARQHPAAALAVGAAVVLVVPAVLLAALHVLGWLLATAAIAGAAYYLGRERRPAPRAAEARKTAARPVARGGWPAPDIAAVRGRAERAERELAGCRAELASAAADRDQARQAARAAEARAEAAERRAAELAEPAMPSEAELREQLARRAGQVSKRLDSPELAARIGGSG